MSGGGMRSSATNAFSAAPICPRPPSITIRSGNSLSFLGEATITPADDFLHRAKIVVADEAFDLKAAVVVLVRPPVREVHHRGDDKRAGDVRDIEALHRARRVGSCKRRRNARSASSSPAGRVGSCRSKRRVFAQRLLERENHVAQLGRFFELLLLRRRRHLRAQAFPAIRAISLREMHTRPPRAGDSLRWSRVLAAVNFLAHIVVEPPACRRAVSAACTSPSRIPNCRRI